jgi:hypothetical protein
VVPRGTLRGDRLASSFHIPNEPDDGAHAAFVAWIAIADHLLSARHYLSRVSRTDPASGLDDDAYQGDLALLERLGSELPAEEWARALRAEVAAAETMARALQAFATRHNLAVAAHIAALRERFPHSFACAGLGR